jgi:hypothetical protein
MAQDPLSHVASWLTPATPAEVAEKAIDPAVALRNEWAAIEEAIGLADAAGDRARLVPIGPSNPRDRGRRSPGWYRRPWKAFLCRREH